MRTLPHESHPDLIAPAPGLAFEAGLDEDETKVWPDALPQDPPPVDDDPPVAAARRRTRSAPRNVGPVRESASEPLQIYLKQMARTPLLCPEAELRICARIDAARSRFGAALFASPAAVREALELLDAVLSGSASWGRTLRLATPGEAESASSDVPILRVRPQDAAPLRTPSSISMASRAAAGDTKRAAPKRVRAASILAQIRSSASGPSRGVRAICFR